MKCAVCECKRNPSSDFHHQMYSCNWLMIPSTFCSSYLSNVLFLWYLLAVVIFLLLFFHLFFICLSFVFSYSSSFSLPGQATIFSDFFYSLFMWILISFVFFYLHMLASVAPNTEKECNEQIRKTQNPVRETMRIICHPWGKMVLFQPNFAYLIHTLADCMRV